MSQRNRISLTLRYRRENELIKQVENYVNQLSTEEIKGDLLEFLLAKYLSLFKNTVTPELYQQELQKSLNFLGGIVSYLEKEQRQGELSPQIFSEKPLTSEGENNQNSEEEKAPQIQRFQRYKLG